MSIPASTHTVVPAPRAVVAGVARLTAALPGGRRLKQCLQNSPTACGITYAAATTGRDEGFTVLTYHGILDRPDPFYGYATPLADFERQVRLLRRFCAVLSLDEILDRLEQGRSLPRRCVTLTFDDGYRDFVTLAGPLLKRHGLPATVFAAVAALERGWLWPDLVRHVLRTTAAGDVELETLTDGGPRVFTLDTLSERLSAVASLDARLKRLEDRAKWTVLEELVWKLLGMAVRDVSIPGLMLTWDELRRIARDGMAVGAHTVTHPILTRMSEQEAAREIVESRQRLETALDVPVRHFAYPNGRPDDVSPAVRRLVKWAGFRSAYTTIEGYNRPVDDRWSLRRLDANQESLRELIRTMADAA